jgi:SAM-dependent methyltransferase
VVERRSKRGKTFYGCSRYPDCDFVAWGKPMKETCPDCGSPYLIEKWLKAGPVAQCPSADAVKQNAKLEGVSEKVRIETGDARKLVYPDSNYDVVVSSLAIHNIPVPEERAQAIREMWRVLKPGGRLMIFDILRTGEYEKVLREAGASDVQLSGMEFLWGLPSRSLVAKK